MPYLNQLKLFKIFVLWLFFTMEIHIHADESGWRTEPDHCRTTDTSCIWQARKHKAQALWGGHPLVSSDETVLWWKNANEVQLVQGSLLTHLAIDRFIHVPFGTISGTGEILIERQPHSCLITTLSGTLQIQAMGESIPLQLPQGYQLWMGDAGPTGKAFVEIPQPAPVDGTLRVWWRHYAGHKNAFLKTVRSFVKEASWRAESTSQWQLKMAERYIASVVQERQRVEKMAKAKAKQQEEMRALFRKMNYLEDDFFK